MNDNTKSLLLSENEVRRRIQALPIGTEPRIKWAGYDLPGEIAEGNFLTVGAAGTGKTLMHRELMRSVIPIIRPGSDRRALIYDEKCDLLSELSTMKPASEVILFNPFDKRSVPWDMAADINSPAAADAVASIFIPSDPHSSMPFFTEAAQRLLAGVLRTFILTRPEKWTLRDVVLSMQTAHRLRRLLSLRPENQDLVETFLNELEERTAHNIISTVVTKIQPLEIVAAMWERTNWADRISLSEWLKKESIIVLGCDPARYTSIDPLNQAMFYLLGELLLSGPETTRGKTWLFMDELRMLGKFEELTSLLNQGRSKGVRCVLGFQDIEGLVRSCGEAETREEILTNCATVSFLKLTSNQTAEWASKLCGEALLPSEFLKLSASASGNVHGVHMIKGLGGIFKSSTRYEFPKSDVPDFEQRPQSDQRLEPWGPEDDKWLED